MTERELSLFNLYLRSMDKKGVIWDFYHQYRLTADEDGLSATSNKELEVCLDKSTHTIINLKNALKNLGLLVDVAKAGHRNLVRFPPVTESVFGKYIANNVRPEVVKEKVLLGKTLYAETVTHKPVDEYDFSETDMQQAATLQKPPLICSVPHNNSNKTYSNKVVVLCETLQKPPHFCSVAPQEENMQEGYSWPTRQKAFQVFNSWNTTLKTYAKRDDITPIPRGLRFEAATFSPTCLASEVCRWIEEQGDEWEETWNIVIEKLKVNSFLQHGHEGFVPSLAWVFKDSGKGKGIERIVDGLYDFKNQKISVVKNEQDAVKVAEQMTSKFKGQSKTYIMKD